MRAMARKHKIAAATIAACIALTGKLEGRSLRTYYDIGGVLTYCDGITGGGVVDGQTFTDKQCDELTLMKVREHIAVIDKHVNVDLSQPQIEALVLFIHNIGETQFRNSTALKRFNSGNMRGGCDAMTWFNRVKGKVVAGLVNRRNDEHKLCVEGLP